MSSNRIDFLIATAGSTTSSGIQLFFDGEEESSSKSYKMLKTGTSIDPGDRVLVLQMAGTYVVLGKIASTN